MQSRLGERMNTILDRIEYKILAIIIEAKQPISHSEIAYRLGCSLEEVDKTCKVLYERKLLYNGMITESGKHVLNTYRVKKAVFLAAGFGSRMVPVTLNTPKPLVRVNGRRLIDGLLDACLDVGIEEIYIVRGYLGEKFDELLVKYPMIKFIDNPFYNQANNISSALLVKNLLSNAYVLEADLLLNNPKIITKYHYRSNFLAIKKEKTDDWCFEVTDGVITEEKIGGINTWQMVGISYWNKEDGLRLSEDIRKAYELPNGKNYYWEQVPLNVYKDHYKVLIRECSENDIVELDTFEELKQIDTSYKRFMEDNNEQTL